MIYDPSIKNIYLTKDIKNIRILPLLDGFDISFLQVLSLSHLNFISL